MTTEILSTLTGIRINDPRDVIDSGFNPKNQGCWIKTDEVYSICDGTIIDIGRDPVTNCWCITIQVNSNIWVRYCYLASYHVAVGNNVTKGQFLGYAYKHLMKVEYCNNAQSQYPVRLNGKTLYKHDPTPILISIRNLSEI